MSLDDIVRDNSPDEQLTDMEAGDLSMKRHSWKYLFAHEPWVSLHILSGSDNQREEALVIESMMEEIVDGETSGYVLGDSEVNAVEEKMEEVRERYL